MQDTEITEPVLKPLRPDMRRAETDIAFRHIVNAEFLRRQEKTRRLRQARIELGADSIRDQ